MTRVNFARNTIQKLFSFRRNGCAAVIITVALIISSPAALAQTTAGATSDSTSSTTETQTTSSQITDNSKTYIITTQNGTGVIIEKPARRMFWEYPQLTAGQARTGRLYIENDTETNLDLSFSSIVLPYDNEKALIYLSKLHIKVTSSDGNTLYDGAYGGIADESGVHISFPPTKPGHKDEYIVTLNCPFNYTGDPENETAEVEWKIIASSVSEPVRSFNGVIVLIVTLVILTCAIIALVVIHYVKSAKKDSK